LKEHSLVQSLQKAKIRKNSDNHDERPNNRNKHLLAVKKDLNLEKSSLHEMNQESLIENFNREECNKELRKGYKKAFLFKVIKSPCIGDLGDLIAFNTDQNKEEKGDQTSLANRDKDKLIYYKNRQIIISQFNKVSIISWIICWIIDIIYYVFQFKSDKKFHLSQSHLMLATMNFFVPMFLKISEAWANALIQSLFSTLKT
jgi:hypothetical protein